MEEPARGSRKRSHLRAHAGLLTILQRHWEWQEHRRTDLEPGFYRYRTVFVAKLGCEDGVRRGQALRGIGGFSHRSPRTRGGGLQWLRCRTFADRPASRIAGLKGCKGMGMLTSIVPSKTKCQRVGSHVFSTALNCTFNWPWSVTMLTKVRLWEFESCALLSSLK